ncbi:M48 family metalloprotease [Thalassotalea sp. PS06]|uniref:M48 family metalloprotease n=1 Tax=Thalassotalea sp. PS06 TaxID=2594005 RepID=UPI00163D6DF4|nr:M48 family metalloprotease [Thalassotalea sp. PS06]
MIKLHTLLLITVTLNIASCKTLEGAKGALTNLVGNESYNDFQGKLIDQPHIQAHRTKNLDVQDPNLALSYSGEKIPTSHVRRHTIVEAPTLQRYVQAIANKLANAWSDSSAKTNVIITNSFDYSVAVDARGNILVPIGFIFNAESDDEVAMMLAHELSHLFLNHHARAESFEEQQEQVDTLAFLVQKANILKDSELIDTSSGTELKYEPTQQGQKNIEKASYYANLINTFSNDIWSTAWGRKQEEEADLLGMDLATQAGYSPRASRTCLQRLDSIQKTKQGHLEQLYNLKLSAMGNAIETLDIGTMQTEIDSTKEQLLGAAANTVTDWFKETHEDPIKRELALRHYVKREHAQHLRRRVDNDSWEQIRNADFIRELQISYRAARNINVFLADDKPEQAKAFVDQLLQSDIHNQPGLSEALFNYYQYINNPKLAEQHLLNINEWSFASVDTYRKAIEVYKVRKDYNNVIKFVDSAKDTFNNDEIFLLEEILAAYQVNDTQRLESALSACKDYPDKVPDCQEFETKVDF